jgi:hypothetical protein
MAMRRIGFLRSYADDVALAGFTLAGGKLITSFILPFASRLFPQPAPAPSPEQQNGQGVSGIAMLYPGLQPYGAYGGGMRGIGVIDPSMQPFGEYAN